MTHFGFAEWIELLSLFIPLTIDTRRIRVREAPFNAARPSVVIIIDAFLTGREGCGKCEQPPVT